MLNQKLQIKLGQTIAVIDSPIQLDLAAPSAAEQAAGAVLIFARTQAELNRRITSLQAAARRGAIVWLAYPKAKLLGTDLNRDRIREYALEHGLDTIRQIAVNDTWSALRLKQT